MILQFLRNFYLKKLSSFLFYKINFEHLSLKGCSFMENELRYKLCPNSKAAPFEGRRHRTEVSVARSAQQNLLESSMNHVQSLHNRVPGAPLVKITFQGLNIDHFNPQIIETTHSNSMLRYVWLNCVMILLFH